MANSPCSSSASCIMTFRPTMEEFKDFSKYIEKIESAGAHKAGLAKIIPPEGWCPRKGGYDNIDLMIPAPISQVASGEKGFYNQYTLKQKAIHISEFKILAEQVTYRTPDHVDNADLEKMYWKDLTYNAPMYGLDVPGSLYDERVEEFNMQRLNTILDMVILGSKIKTQRVNAAYLHFGMWKTTFAWHTEVMDLYSITYLHFGAPISWYVVPPEQGRRLEQIAAEYFKENHAICPAFLRHRRTIIDPRVLGNFSIETNKITQVPGEFIVTFPFAYHAGFNHGYNCAESANFATPRWVEYGKRAARCTCRNSCGKICMDVFVRKFQPDRYEAWKAGKDYGYHPEDPTEHCAAPLPRKLDSRGSIRKSEDKQKSEHKQSRKQGFKDKKLKSNNQVFTINESSK